MSTATFSPDGLARLHQAMDSHLGRGVPGIVTAVSRGDEVHVDVLGSKTAGGQDPVRRDTLFRLTSMTKPIIAAAAMTFLDEGKLRLDDPVDGLLPELANRRVLVRLDGPVNETLPARRPITVRDLLTFRLGFGQIWSPPGALPIQRAEAELALGTLGPPAPATPPPPDEWIRRFGTLPLMHQPGEVWMYNTGAAVLGVLLARAAGRPLETVLRDRIFEPLGMKDTSFGVPPGKLDRLASCYRRDPASGALILHDGVEGSQWSRPPAFPDGAAGLVSTIDDYLAFARMLLRNGVHGGRRVIAEASVRAMTTDQLTAEQRVAGRPFLGPADRGWGFGVGVLVSPDGRGGQPGRYGWDGGFGTSWANDPARDLVGILLTQKMWDEPKEPPVCSDFWTRAYAALA
jgi:CubicO group peptidase (beta-lactamase class C family)